MKKAVTNQLFRGVSPGDLSLKNLCDQYGIGEVTASLLPLTGGLIHDVWYLQTTSGRYALKKVNVNNLALLNKTIASVDFFEGLAAHYQSEGLQTRVAQQSLANNKIETCVQGFKWMLFPWVAGEIRMASHATLEDIRQVGEILNHIQQRTPNFSGVSLPQWFGFSLSRWSDLIEQAECKGLSWYGEAKQNVFLLRDWSEKAADCAKALQRDLIISHRDLSPSNIIWNCDNLPVVIDWEYGGLVNPESERFNTAMTWALRSQFEVDGQAFAAFIEGTKQSFHIPYATLLAGFAGYLLEWCEFNMQRSLLNASQVNVSSSEVLSVIAVLKAIHQ